MERETPAFTNIYQLSGVDDRERGFTRQVRVKRIGERYQAVLSYEKFRIEGQAADSEEAAMQTLIQALHARGYTQIRTQLIFRADRYLGSQEPWREYADPRTRAGRNIVWGWMTRWLQRLWTR
ncbi:MAG: hypothetical protein D6690_11770 [Nitrospirae bacterium]|nr:MAG: hypothetical protein D6690_11770 [Nitrospirota bacterium]